MEAQSKSECKSEEKHNGNECEDCDDLGMNVKFSDLDGEKGKSCVRKEWTGGGDETDMGQGKIRLSTCKG